MAISASTTPTKEEKDDASKKEKLQVKVKVQSLNAPVTTHHFTWQDLQWPDSSKKTNGSNSAENGIGKPSLLQLQDLILRTQQPSSQKISETTTSKIATSSGTQLKCSLSYIDVNEGGDLVPLTSQAEFEDAIANLQTTTLLVLAQVLHSHDDGGVSKNTSTPTTSNATLDEYSTSATNTTTMESRVEERLAAIEALLLKQGVGHNRLQQPPSMLMLVDDAESVVSATPSCASHNKKDYSAIVKDHQASMATRLNKVKSMNASATATSAASPYHSPARPKASLLMENGTDHADTNSVHDLLQQLIQERQEERKELRDMHRTWQKEMKQQQEQVLQQVQQQVQQQQQQQSSSFVSQTNLPPPSSNGTSAQDLAQAMQEQQVHFDTQLQSMQTALEQKLEQHITSKLTQLQTDLTAKHDKQNQQRLVAQARDAVALTDAMEAASEQMQASIANHLSQWETKLKQFSPMETPPPVEKFSNRDMTKDMVKQVMNAMQPTLDTLRGEQEVMTKLVQDQQTTLQQLQQQQSNSSNNGKSSIQHTVGSVSSLKLNFQMLSQTMDNRLQRIEQMIQQQQQQQLLQQSASPVQASRGEKKARGAAPTPAPLDTESLATKEQLEYIRQDLMQQLNDLESKLIGQLTFTSASNSSQSHEKEWKAVQEKLVEHQTENASALRETILERHQEIMTQLQELQQQHQSSSSSPSKAAASSQTASSSMTATTSDSSTFASPPPSHVTPEQLEALKQVVLSSHDDLLDTHETSLQEHQNYLVECIELAQHSILTHLKQLGNATNRPPVSGIVAMELEGRISQQMEVIQAQATAAILDRMDQWQQQQPGRRLLGARAALPSSNASVHSELTSPSTDEMVENDDNENTPEKLDREVVATSSDENAVSVAQMEEMLLTAMDKVEEVMASSCENIQAQATAAVLDKIQSLQEALLGKLDEQQPQHTSTAARSVGHSVTRSSSENAAATTNMLKEKCEQLEHALTSMHQQWDKIHPDEGSSRHQQFPSTAAARPRQRSLEEEESKQEHAHTENKGDDVFDANKMLERAKTIFFSGAQSANVATTAASSFAPPSLAEAKYATLTPNNGNNRRQEPASRTRKYYQKRFKDFESRSNQLERAYDCIKYNRPLTQPMQTSLQMAGFREEDEQKTYDDDDGHDNRYQNRNSFYNTKAKVDDPLAWFAPTGSDVHDAMAMAGQR